MSTRSTWSGTIQLGLLNVPITLAKAWEDGREKSLRTVCTCCKQLVDKSERCPKTGEPPAGKARAVELPDGTFRVLNANELAQIEDATKDDTLTILDVQPLAKLPLVFATGTYYVRADKKSKGAVQPFGLLAKALADSGMGLVAKWCSATKQRLVVLHAFQGMIVLRTVPMAAEVRMPGDQEKAHKDVAMDEGAVKMLRTLFEATQQERFDHAAYEDEGLRLRTEAVDRLLAGGGDEKAPEGGEQKVEQPLDLMATLMASIEKQKEAVEA